MDEFREINIFYFNANKKNIYFVKKDKENELT